MNETNLNLSQADWATGAQQKTDAVILDVRTPMEWSEGVIPTALMHDIMQGPAFVENIKDLDKSKAYYVYCKSGGRSGQACTLMQQLGFSEVYNLIGGITAWQGDLVSPE